MKEPEKQLTEKLFTKDLEQRLSDIHASAVESRNAANDTLGKLAELRGWITQQEIAKLKAAPDRAGKE